MTPASLRLPKRTDTRVRSPIPSIGELRMCILTAPSGIGVVRDAVISAECQAASAMRGLESPVFRRRAAFAVGLLCAGFAVVLMTDAAWAAGSGFDRLQSTLSQWVTGSLGKSLALGFLLIGLASGLLRGNLSAAVVALGAALALVVGPEIIESVFTTSG